MLSWKTWHPLRMEHLSFSKVSKLITELTAAASFSSPGLHQWWRWPTETISLWWNRWENFIHPRSLKARSQFLRRNGNKLWSPRQKETSFSEQYSLHSNGNTSTSCSGTFSDNAWIWQHHLLSSISRFSCKPEITISRVTLISGISPRHHTWNGLPPDGNGPLPYPWFWFCSKLSTSWLKNNLISCKPCSAQDQPARWSPWSTKSNSVCLTLLTRSSTKDRSSTSSSQMPTSSSGWALLCHKWPPFQESSCSVSAICSML